MGLFAQRAAARMQTERIYRTMSRMQQGRSGTLANQPSSPARLIRLFSSASSACHAHLLVARPPQFAGHRIVALR